MISNRREIPSTICKTTHIQRGGELLDAEGAALVGVEDGESVVDIRDEVDLLGNQGGARNTHEERKREREAGGGGC